MRRSAPRPAFHRPLVPGAASILAIALPLLFVMGRPAPALAASRHAPVTAPASAAASKERAAPAARRYRTARPPVQRTSSDETAAERDRRLARECRGLPNAGACLGYAR